MKSKSIIIIGGNMLEKYLQNDLLIVCPNKIKMRILNRYCNQLTSFKFMTKEEFKSHYFFSYDNQAILYLMEKYHYHIDVAKTYLENLYVVDLNKEYKSKKLIFLKELKRELIMNQLLQIDPLFSDYLKTKKIIVLGYGVLEKYEEKMFCDADIIKNEMKKLDIPVFACDTLEEEILFVIEKILQLVKQKVELNQIYIANITDEYLYPMKKLFSYFHIPIQLDMKECIYGTKIVKDYLTTKKIPAFKTKISSKLVEVINNLVELKDSKYYQDFLIEKLKHTYLKPQSSKNEVHIINLEEEQIGDNDYLFVVGFNQDSMPKIYKDEDFITDKIKQEVDLYQTKDKNKMSKEHIIGILSNTKNLYLSYKKRSNFNYYLPSSFIEELNLEVIPYNGNKIYTSNLYNKIFLTHLLDLYYKYGETSLLLKKLMSHYSLDYDTYNNQFTRIHSTNIRNYMNNSLRLSYTSLNTYNLCAFKYYISYVLKLKPSEDTFFMFIGNIFHYIFSIMYHEHFSFDREWNKYLDKYDLSVKERVLLENLKEKLKEDISIIKDLEMLSSYKDILTEEEITIKLKGKENVFLTGKIDKIMYKKDLEDTYFSLVDYKTGNINTDIGNMKYGLNMQLPIYLYLLSNSKLFTSPIFTGMYFQKVLYPNLKWESNKSLDNMKKNNLKLQGYSTDSLENLEFFDRSYENSEWIRGMKINKDGSFSKNSKVLSDSEIYNTLKYTKKMIEECTDHILNGDFSINPKIVDKKKACDNCNFKDLCFVNPKNFIYLEKVENLDFLGGDNNG